MTLKNIQRTEPKFFGWKVHIKRRGRSHVRYFADGDDGPFESLRNAIKCRDEMWKELGPPVFSSSKDLRSSSGTVGVTREVTQDSTGNIRESWRASWLDANGRRNRRAFGVDKYGEADAKRMAIAARKAGLAATKAIRERRLLDTLFVHERLVRSR